MVYTPDCWVIVKIKTDKETHYRVFASWYGGYLDGSSWQMNSGITHYTESDGAYHFYGVSGSIYSCTKATEGFSGYSAGVFNQLQESIRPDKMTKVTMKTYRKTHHAKP